MRKYLVKLLEDRIAHLKSDLLIILEKINYSPVQEYIDMRADVREKMSKFSDNLTAMQDPEFNAFISKCAEREKVLMKQMKDPKRDEKLWADRAEIEYELHELNNVLCQEKYRG